MRAIERDFYRYVPKDLQGPLCSYLRRGVEPTNPLLMAELNGQLQLSGECPPPRSSIAGCKSGGVTTFLNKHADRFDIAHGHPGFVLRWMMRGGEGGRFLVAIALVVLAADLFHHHLCPFFWC